MVNALFPCIVIVYIVYLSRNMPFSHQTWVGALSSGACSMTQQSAWPDGWTKHTGVFFCHTIHDERCCSLESQDLRIRGRTSMLSYCLGSWQGIMVVTAMLRWKQNKWTTHAERFTPVWDSSYIVVVWSVMRKSREPHTLGLPWLIKPLCLVCIGYYMISGQSIVSVVSCQAVRNV